MPVITFICHDGSTHDVDAAIGSSLMQTALDHDIVGIVGECGGTCSCATCHCYLSEQEFARLPPGPIEKDMLDCVCDPEPTSRLGCQVVIDAEMDGAQVRLPASQY